MEASFRNIITIPETRAKVFTTIWLLLAYRTGFQVPIPGMSAEFLSGSNTNPLFGLMSAFSGGQLGQTTIFGLGIMPYISASIIFSMLTKISPAMEAVAKEGASGQKKINQWTRLATVPIALIQAFFVYTGVFLNNPRMISPGMQDSQVMLGVVVIASLIAGAMIVMWIGELITEHGVGNGASLIIMAGIIASMPQSFLTLSGTGDFWNTLLFISGIWGVVVFVVVFMHKGARRIPVQYARLTRGRRVYGGQRHYLPLKVNMAGVIPAIFASSILLFPASLGTWFAQGDNMEWLQTLAQAIGPGKPLNIILFSAGIIFFCFFYTALMFNPKDVAENLKKSGAFIPGIRPGEQSARYIDSVLTRLTLFGALYMTAVCLLPQFLVWPPVLLVPAVLVLVLLDLQLVLQTGQDRLICLTVSLRPV